MAERGITGDVADEIYDKLAAFANYGFPESHSVSFAYLVYSSSWIKLPLPGGVLRGAAQRPADGLLLAAHARAGRPPPRGRGARPERQRVAARLHARAAHRRPSGPIGRPRPRLARRPVDPRGAARAAVRARAAATRCSTASTTSAAEQPFTDLEDFVRRTGAPADALEALATAGAFECFGVDRRAALWAAGALRDARPEPLPGVVTGAEAPTLPGMTEIEDGRAPTCGRPACRRAAPHRVRARRARRARGVVTARRAARAAPTARVVEVAGVVTHRQQPATAKGTVFLNLEDETGLINVICTQGVWKRFRKVARSAPALRIRGVLEKHQGVINVVAGRIARAAARPRRRCCAPATSTDRASGWPAQRPEFLRGTNRSQHARVDATVARDVTGRRCKDFGDS